MEGYITIIRKKEIQTADDLIDIQNNIKTWNEIKESVIITNFVKVK